jgi:hypothetical protein
LHQKINNSSGLSDIFQTNTLETPMKMKKNIFIVSTMAALFFIYGMAVGHYKIFPYAFVKTTYQTLMPNNSFKDDDGYSESDESFAFTSDSNRQIREKTEWMQFYAKSANAEKKRILFVGDSIVNEYYNDVCDQFSNYSCVKFTTSTSIVNDDFINQLNYVLGAYDYEFIHFNNGLHGFKHSEDQYENSFRKVVELLVKKAGRNVALAESTPLDESLGNRSILEHRNIRINDRNEIVHNLATEFGLTVNPLHSAINPSDGDFKDAYHQTPKGIAKLSDIVATFVASKIDD